MYRDVSITVRLDTVEFLSKSFQDLLATVYTRIRDACLKISAKFAKFERFLLRFAGIGRTAGRSTGRPNLQTVVFIRGRTVANLDAR
jgi:hypothetical protein